MNFKEMFESKGIAFCKIDNNNICTVTYKDGRLAFMDVTGMSDSAILFEIMNM